MASMATGSRGTLEIPVRDDGVELVTLDRGARVLAAFEEVGITVKDKDVVDLGAGFGSLALAAASAGARAVMAVDVHPDRLAAIERKAAAAGVVVTTREANLLEPWDHNRTADVAFLIGVVEYAGLWDLDAPVETLQRRVFETAFDALRPGGTLVFASKNRLWPRFIWRDANTGQPLLSALPRNLADSLSQRFSGEAYRHHIHSPSRWSELVRGVGFTDVEVYLPYLSYQFPLKLVRRGSFHAQREARSRVDSGEEFRVAWGRLGSGRASIMSLAAAFGFPVSHGVFVIATKS